MKSLLYPYYDYYSAATEWGQYPRDKGYSWPYEGSMQAVQGFYNCSIPMSLRVLQGFYKGPTIGALFGPYKFL